MDDNRKKLQFKDRLLWSRVAEKSESNQVEFRRRIDLLDAAQSSATPIWVAIDTKTNELKLASKGRRMWIEFAIFSAGALINWLFSSDGRPYFDFGAVLMVGASCSYLLGLTKLFRLESEIKKLVEQQSLYLFHWLGTGASNEDFWRCRRNAIQMNQLEENSKDTDLWRAEYEELEDMSRNRLLNIRNAILCRTSGDYLSDWVLELDSMNLATDQGVA